MSELIEKKTIGEVEHIVHASGQWDGNSAVEFSNDGVTWTEAWAPTDEHPLPTFARVTVHRKDVQFAAPKTIRWDEYVPRVDEFWAGKWVGAPTRHFGRTARMAAYRESFRDLLGDIAIEDEGDEPWAAPARAERPTELDAPARDWWAAEIAGAETLEQLAEVDKAARAARVFTPDAAGTALHRSLKARRRDLAAAQSPAQTPGGGEPSPVGPPASEQESHGDTAPGRREPRDHQPPVNRAARRAAARKKGRR